MGIDYGQVLSTTVLIMTALLVVETLNIFNIKGNLVKLFECIRKVVRVIQCNNLNDYRKQQVLQRRTVVLSYLNASVLGKFFFLILLCATGYWVSWLLNRELTAEFMEYVVLPYPNLIVCTTALIYSAYIRHKK